MSAIRKTPARRRLARPPRRGAGPNEITVREMIVALNRMERQAGAVRRQLERRFQPRDAFVFDPRITPAPPVDGFVPRLLARCDTGRPGPADLLVRLAIIESYANTLRAALTPANGPAGRAPRGRDRAVEATIRAGSRRTIQEKKTENPAEFRMFKGC